MLMYLIFCILVHSITAQYDCKDFLEAPVRNITVHYPSNDDVIDSLYINDIEDAEVEDSAYINATVDNNYLIIKASTKFQESIGSESYVASVVLKCEDDDYMLNYIISVQYCHGVEFNEPAYSFTFYGFMEKGEEIDIGAFGRITVKCLVGSAKFDIIENDYFKMDNEDNGTIIALQDIHPPPIFNETFIVIGWDDFVTKEEPARTSVQIILNPMYEGLISFTDATYYGYIDFNLDVVIENGPIALETDISISDIYIEISSEYASFFDIKYSENEVLLVAATDTSLVKLDIEDDTITLVITAYDVRSLDNSAVTFVILNVLFSREQESSTLLPRTTLVNINEITDETSEDKIKETTETINIDFPDEQFIFWVSNTKTLIVIMMIIFSFTIFSAIIFLKIRMSSRSMTY